MTKNLVKTLSILAIFTMGFTSITNYQIANAAPIINDCVKYIVTYSRHKSIDVFLDPASGAPNDVFRDVGDGGSSTFKDVEETVCNATTLSVDGPTRPPRSGGGGGSTAITRHSAPRERLFSFSLADLWRDSCEIPGLNSNELENCRILADFAVGDITGSGPPLARRGEFDIAWSRGALIEVVNAVSRQLAGDKPVFDYIAETLAAAIGCPSCAETIKNSAARQLFIELFTNAAAGFAVNPDGSMQIAFTAIGVPIVNPQVLTHPNLNRSDGIVKVGESVMATLSKGSLSALYKLFIEGKSPYKIIQTMIAKGYLKVNGIVRFDIQFGDGPSVGKSCAWSANPPKPGETGIALEIKCN